MSSEVISEPSSLRAYARHRGVSLAAVQHAIKAKRITRRSDGLIDVEEADQEWDRNTAPTQQTVVTANEPLAANPNAVEYSRARAVRENYLARLAKFDFEVRTGKLVDKAEVEVAAFNRFRMFRDAMLTIPDRMAAVLAAETDERKVFELLSADIRRALSDFADGSR